MTFEICDVQFSMESDALGNRNHSLLCGIISNQCAVLRGSCSANANFTWWHV